MLFDCWCSSSRVFWIWLFGIAMRSHLLSPYTCTTTVLLPYCTQSLKLIKINKQRLSKANSNCNNNNNNNNNTTTTTSNYNYSITLKVPNNYHSEEKVETQSTAKQKVACFCCLYKYCTILHYFYITLHYNSFDFDLIWYNFGSIDWFYVRYLVSPLMSLAFSSSSRSSSRFLLYNINRQHKHKHST